jgi:hypothetical protein
MSKKPSNIFIYSEKFQLMVKQISKNKEIYESFCKQKKKVGMMN